jgi:hypothetical protein
MLIAGCSSEFYKHDSVFRTNQHVAYSWWGYKSTTPEAAKMSADQGWWGKKPLRSGEVIQSTRKIHEEETAG